MRLIVARCEVLYDGRLSTRLPEAVRLILLKADGSVMVHADSGGYKPLNWMSPPTAIEEHDDRLRITRLRPPAEQIEIKLCEVLADQRFTLDASVQLEKDGVERELQDLLERDPLAIREGLRLVRREWATDLGPVDLMCRDELRGGYVAIEVKRVATIAAVEQLSRYLERIGHDPSLRPCSGILVACEIKPQARTLAKARGIECVEIDLQALRAGGRNELQLFAA